jgi:hypothetical protein
MSRRRGSSLPPGIRSGDRIMVPLGPNGPTGPNGSLPGNHEQNVVHFNPQMNVVGINARTPVERYERRENLHELRERSREDTTNQQVTPPAHLARVSGEWQRANAVGLGNYICDALGNCIPRWMRGRGKRTRKINHKKRACTRRRH